MNTVLEKREIEKDREDENGERNNRRKTKPQPQVIHDKPVLRRRHRCQKCDVWVNQFIHISWRSKNFV